MSRSISELSFNHIDNYKNIYITTQPQILQMFRSQQLSFAATTKNVKPTKNISPNHKECKVFHVNYKVLHPTRNNVKSNQKHFSVATKLKRDRVLFSQLTYEFLIGRRFLVGQICMTRNVLLIISLDKTSTFRARLPEYESH